MASNSTKEFPWYGYWAAFLSMNVFMIQETPSRTVVTLFSPQYTLDGMTDSWGLGLEQLMGSIKSLNVPEGSLDVSHGSPDVSHGSPDMSHSSSTSILSSSDELNCIDEPEDGHQQSDKAPARESSYPPGLTPEEACAHLLRCIPDGVGATFSTTSEHKTTVPLVRLIFEHKAMKEKLTEGNMWMLSTTIGGLFGWNGQVMNQARAAAQTVGPNPGWSTHREFVVLAVATIGAYFYFEALSVENPHWEGRMEQLATSDSDKDDVDDSLTWNPRDPHMKSKKTTKKQTRQSKQRFVSARTQPGRKPDSGSQSPALTDPRETAGPNEAQLSDMFQELHCIENSPRNYERFNQIMRLLRGAFYERTQDQWVATEEHGGRPMDYYEYFAYKMECAREAEYNRSTDDSESQSDGPADYDSGDPVDDDSRGPVDGSSEPGDDNSSAASNWEDPADGSSGDSTGGDWGNLQGPADGDESFDLGGFGPEDSSEGRTTAVDKGKGKATESGGNRDPRQGKSKAKARAKAKAKATKAKGRARLGRSRSVSP
ncbi:hypothetical protein BD413DRAFT_63048 [Trametes elegans]|nr:hypothetical protein BD413DRAFT_63048 [Trametes elegans]